MSRDREEKREAHDNQKDSGDRKVEKTSKKTADEAVADAPQAKRHAESFTTFSKDQPAVNPLVLEDSKTGKKLYDGSDRAKTNDHKLTKQELISLPDYKSIGASGIVPKMVFFEMGPSDNPAIESRYKRLLAEQKTDVPFSAFDEDKLHKLAKCDVMLDKYQRALSEQEYEEASRFPQPMKGAYLAGLAVEDGAAIGCLKTTFHKLVGKGEFDAFLRGTVSGAAAGELLLQLAASKNPWFRRLATTVSIGGLALAVKEVSDIGMGEAVGLMNSVPDLEKLMHDPSRENFAHAKRTTEKHLGPPTAQASEFTLGVLLGHGLEKVTGAGVSVFAKRGASHIQHGSDVPHEPHSKKVHEGKEGEPHKDTADSTKASDHAHKDFAKMEVKEIGRLRLVEINGEKHGLFGTEGFYKGKGLESKEAVSPVKIHILTDSPADLHRLQAELFPELKHDPTLAKHVEIWKTMDPLFGMGKGGDGVMPTGQDQGAKGFTLYFKTAEDALIVSKRLEEIIQAKGLGLKTPLDTKNCDLLAGPSNRIGIVRDTFIKATDPSGVLGFQLDDALMKAIYHELKLGADQKLTPDHLKFLESRAGIEKGLLAYSNEGKLMLKSHHKATEDYHGGHYAPEADCVKDFEHLTDRAALYSLYQKFGLDPAEVAIRRER